MRGCFAPFALLVACVEFGGGTGPKGTDEDVTDGPDVIGDVPGSGDGGDGDEEEEDGSFLYAGEVHDFAIELDEAALAVLQAATAGGGEDVHATFRYGEESYDVGLHLRGGVDSFQPWTGKPSFKIDFHEWDPDQEFHGVRRMTLTNLVADPSMLCEQASYALYQAMALPAPRHAYARVTVNGELFGLYGILETADEQFVKRNWEDDDGNLYEGSTDLYAGYEDNFELAEQGDETRRVELYDLVDALDAATPATWMATLEAHFDVDRLFDVWAVELVSGDTGGYVATANNYLLYWDPSARRWTMAPWGSQMAFVAELDVTGLYASRLYQGCFASAECSERLHIRVAAVLEKWEATDFPAWVTGQADLIAADCVADPRSPWGPEGCTTGREALLGFLERRPDQIRAQLGLEDDGGGGDTGGGLDPWEP